MVTRKIVWLSAVTIVLVSVSALPVAADITPPPRATAVVDGRTYPIALRERSDGIYTIDNFAISTSGFRMRINGSLDSDPAIAYAIALTDMGGPTSFMISFFSPIVPTGSPNVVSSGIVGGLTDFTGNGVSLSPLSGSTIQSSFVHTPRTNMGVDVGPAFSHGPAGHPATYAYGPYSDGPQPGPSGIWTGLEVVVAFTLSGGNDAVALTGFASIDEATVVPAPTTVMGGLGLLGTLAAFGGVRRRFAMN